MKTAAQLSPIQEVGLEVFKTLEAYWVYKRQSEKLITKNPRGIGALEYVVVMQALYQDIVLRLCKIGDTRKDTWGLKQVAKYAKKHLHIKSLPSDIEKRINEYEQAIQGLKDRQRNGYMAHISQKKANLVKPPDDFREAILLAVRICDELHGETVEYKIGPEWGGVEINLRELV